MVELIVVYAIGTLLGIWFGYKSGIVKGASTMLDGLIDNEMVLVSTKANGEVVIIKPTIENIQRNQ